MEIDTTVLVTSVVGGAVTIVGGAVKIMFGAKKELEDQVDNLTARLASLAPRDTIDKEIEGLWMAMEQRRVETDRWRSEIDRAMVTKDDLRGLEARLLGAIRGAVLERK